MSRSRQIPAVDINARERVLNQPHPQSQPNKPRPNAYHYPMQQKRPVNNIMQKIRSGNAQSLISGSCSSMRDFCSNVQSITSDINNLLTSIETILPIIGTYLSATQAKETIPIPTSAPAVNEPVKQAYNLSQPKANQPTATAGNNNASNINNTRPDNALKQPRPEDLQQFLENPLVKNVLNNFMQNMTNNMQK